LENAFNHYAGSHHILGNALSRLPAVMKYDRWFRFSVISFSPRLRVADGSAGAPRSD